MQVGRKVAARTALALSVLVAAGVGVAPSPARAADDDHLLSILAIGDSYTAGNGASFEVDEHNTRTEFGPKTCHRNSMDYARQFQTLVEKSGSGQRVFVENQACSGAVTQDFYHSQHDGLPPQQEAVNAGYDLIFLTIGGNDLKFADAVAQCLVAASDNAVKCDSILTAAEHHLDDTSDNGLGAQIRGVLRAIGERKDPRAKVVLVGYPQLESDATFTLTGGGKTVKVGQRVRDGGTKLDALQQQAVDAVNGDRDPLGRLKSYAGDFVFISVKALFATHELSAKSVNPKRWMVDQRDVPGVELVNPGSREHLYHPNQTGHYNEAKLLFDHPLVTKRDLNSGPPPIDTTPAPPGGVPTGPLDLTFVIDTTGSMGDDIEAVKLAASSLVGQLVASGRDVRIGLVDYKDLYACGDDGYAARVDLPLGDPEGFGDAVSALSASGGCDEPESVYSGIMTALGMSWRGGAQRAVIVLGDAPPHDPEPTTGYTLETVLAAARSHGVVVSSTAGSSARLQAMSADESTELDPVGIFTVDIGGGAGSLFEQLAAETGGRHLSPSDATTVVPALAEAIGTIVGLGPVAQEDYYGAVADEMLSVAAPGVLGNDDLQGSSLEAATIATALGGVVRLAADGSFTYMPPPGVHGADSFEYSLVKDGSEPTHGTVRLTIDEETCANATPTITGTPRSDHLMGTPGHDVIFGYEGDDVLYGRGGDDLICGGPGNDRLSGGGGSDFLDGGSGHDALSGDEGPDRLQGGEGTDVLAGGSGDDLLSGGAGLDLLSGGQGRDTCAWDGWGAGLCEVQVNDPATGSSVRRAAWWSFAAPSAER